MEFDPLVQGRWKASLWCFGFGVAAIALVALTDAAWHAAHYFAGAAVCFFGILFALLSLAAGEKQRTMAWAALLLNSILPGLLIIGVLSLFW